MINSELNFTLEEILPKFPKEIPGEDKALRRAAKKGGEACAGILA